MGNKSNQFLNGTIENDQYLLKRINLLTQQMTAANAAIAGNTVIINNNTEVVIQNALEATGNATFKSLRYNTGAMSGASWTTFGLGLPGGVTILGVTANVDVAGAGGTWGVSFSGGSTTPCFPNNNSIIVNTKAGKNFVPEVTTGDTELAFLPDSGSLNDLSVTVIIYYLELADMVDV
tara:strand:+ start:4115 stop:4648 length:534 start_codon:yes stop_codon:yes gene_type:complete